MSVTRDGIEVRDLVELLRERGRIAGAPVAGARTRGGPSSARYTVLEDGEHLGMGLGFAELERRAAQVSAGLLRRVEPGSRVLVVQSAGLEFLVAFFGCLGAGMVAVPTAMPHRARPRPGVERLRVLARDAGVAAVLASREGSAHGGASATDAPELGQVPWIAVEDCALETPDRPSLGVDGGSTAFLQYTSGSTADPKGVIVSHGNLLANLSSIQAVEGNDETSRGLTWLPPHHDMGLIEGLLSPLFGDYPTWIMSPAAFLQRPLRWLHAITSLGITQTGGPDFAYGLCLKKLRRRGVGGLDLGTWRVAYNGSEPVRAATLDAFGEALAPAGFRPSAWYPVYGLAEGTLVVSSRRRDEVARTLQVDAKALLEDRLELGGEGERRSLVPCGRPVPNSTVRIVDPDSREALEEGRVGEIWVRGPSVAQGYFGRDELSSERFGAHTLEGEGPFLRTGDLGALQGGELVVTGRRKDLIIVRGRKLYPQDIEITVEGCDPGIRSGGVAAARRSTSMGDAFDLYIELDPRREHRSPIDRGELDARVRSTVTADHGASPAEVRFVCAGALPRTSSGKLRRHACLRTFQDLSLQGEPT